MPSFTSYYRNKEIRLVSCAQAYRPCTLAGQDLQYWTVTEYRFVVWQESKQFWRQPDSAGLVILHEWMTLASQRQPRTASSNTTPDPMVASGSDIKHAKVKHESLWHAAWRAGDSHRR